MNVINQESLDIETNWIPSIIAIDNITRNTGKMRMLTAELLLADEASEKNQLERELKDVWKFFDEWRIKYESLISSQEEHATEKFSQLFDTYAVILQQTLEASRQNKPEETT